MSRGEFKKFIESIGFKKEGWYYVYKEFRIKLYPDYYTFYNGSKWVGCEIDDLTPIENYFKKELRSIKLKQLFV